MVVLFHSPEAWRAKEVRCFLRFGTPWTSHSCRVLMSSFLPAEKENNKFLGLSMQEIFSNSEKHQQQTCTQNNEGKERPRACVFWCIDSPEEYNRSWRSRQRLWKVVQHIVHTNSWTTTGNQNTQVVPGCVPIIANISGRGLLLPGGPKQVMMKTLILEKQSKGSRGDHEWCIRQDQSHQEEAVKSHKSCGW